VLQKANLKDSHFTLVYLNIGNILLPYWVPQPLLPWTWNILSDLWELRVPWSIDYLPSWSLLAMPVFLLIFRSTLGCRYSQYPRFTYRKLLGSNLLNFTSSVYEEEPEMEPTLSASRATRSWAFQSQVWNTWAYWLHLLGWLSLPHWPVLLGG
jgi:hypothetical protein